MVAVYCLFRFFLWVSFRLILFFSKTHVVQVLTAPEYNIAAKQYDWNGVAQTQAGNVDLSYGKDLISGRIQHFNIGPIAFILAVLFQK